MTEETRCEPPPEWRERDGWHWVQCMNGPEPDSYAPELVFWYAPNSTSRYSGPAGWDDSDLAEPEAGYRYLAPVTPPAVVAALVEALEGLMVGNAHRPAGYDYDLGMYLPATWPTKSIPSDDALSAARAALAAYREAGR